jgi:acrylyl-CoA reductase (NADPH)
MFDALVIRKPDGAQTLTRERLDDGALPEGDVTVDIAHSTLNYKDGLAITGKGPVVRGFPMVPGIDFAGRVRDSAHPEYKPGDLVILNGWGVGESHWGGLAQRARVKGDWLIPLPTQLTTWDAMALGTAGYTAMLCVQALERAGLTPASGEILVTGARGGVGSLAIGLLAKRGFTVLAATRRPEDEAALKALGAHGIVDAAELSAPGRPLAKERWAGAVDSVGSHILANVCAATRADGAVAACGMAMGLDFPASVAPFILRGVSLLGVNSVTRPKAERVSAWAELARLHDGAERKAVTRTIGLDAVEPEAEALMAGTAAGRVVVDVNA